MCKPWERATAREVPIGSKQLKAVSQGNADDCCMIAGH